MDNRPARGDIGQQRQMKAQITLYLDAETMLSACALQQAGQYDSRNQAIEHAIRRGLDALRDEYKHHQRTLPSKPKSRRKCIWDQKCIDLYGE
jgi:hypothetical protein